MRKNILAFCIVISCVSYSQSTIYDSIFHDEKAIIVPKNPDEYFFILKWHQENSIFD